MRSPSCCRGGQLSDFFRRVHAKRDTRGTAIIPQNSFFAYNFINHVIASRIMSLRRALLAMKQSPHVIEDCFVTCASTAGFDTADEHRLLNPPLSAMSTRNDNKRRKI